MTYAYRQTLTTTPMGDNAFEAFRDAIEEMASGSVDEGEELAVVIEGENRISITLRSHRNLRSNELDGLSEAIRTVASDCLEIDDELVITGFEVVEVPKVTRPAI